MRFLEGKTRYCRASIIFTLQFQNYKTGGLTGRGTGPQYTQQGQAVTLRLFLGQVHCNNMFAKGVKIFEASSASALKFNEWET